MLDKSLLVTVLAPFSTISVVSPVPVSHPRLSLKETKLHYYKFNVADWLASTRHLTPEEEGVYFRLINYYYDTEKPIPLETQPVIRRLLLTNHAGIVDQILAEFFVKTERGYEKEKCNELIKDYKKTAQRNRKNGAAGGRPRKGAACKETQSVTDGMPEEAEGKASGNLNQELLTINHKPLTTNDVADAKTPACPHAEIIKIYNETLPELTNVLVDRWGGQREKDLRTRWKEDPRHQEIEFWRWFFGKLKNYPFYLGGNDRAWKADLGWMLKKTNFDKLLEKFVNES